MNENSCLLSRCSTFWNGVWTCGLDFGLLYCNKKIANLLVFVIVVVVSLGGGEISSFFCLFDFSFFALFS